jgi:hypothetical protein
MSDEAVGATAEMMSEQMTMLEALHEIAMSSPDAEMVRVAMSALTRTEAGVNYLRLHPLTL